MARKQVGPFLKKDNKQTETSFREQITGGTSGVIVNNNNTVENDKGDDDEGEDGNTQLDHSTLLRTRGFEAENDVDEEEELWCTCTERRQCAIILMSCLTIILAVSIVSAIVYIRIYVQPVHGIRHHGHKHHINSTKGPFTANVTTQQWENGSTTISVKMNSTKILQFTSSIQLDFIKNNSTEKTTAEAVADQTSTISTARQKLHDFLEGHVHR